jgi:hypothetical protein
MRSRILLGALVAALLLLSLPAAAFALRGTLDRAAAALRSDPVYSDPSAERRLSPADERRVRSAIGGDSGPVYIAVLPKRAVSEAGGDPSAALARIAREVGEPGTYAAVIGESFRAGATAGILPRGEAARLAAEALAANRSRGTAPVLVDFVHRVADARSNGGGSGGGGGGGGFPGWLLALLAIPAALFGFNRWRRRKRERAELEEVKRVARDDLVALGDDIRALDIDVQMPNADQEAKAHYARAVECYQQAEDALERARRPDDLERVTSLLEEGRYAMTAAKARFEGKPVPERRPPCFFDPRHGPSTTDVEWAPPGGAPRPVPVCAADAQRIQDGLEPEARRVPVDGRMVPYWNAGPAYGPWAGGFFGGGLLPGLLIGSALGGGLGFFGGMAAEAAAEDYGGGDFGDPGDTGDFGGGLDDIGGGDFGGGDFGGGGDF